MLRVCWLGHLAVVLLSTSAVADVWHVDDDDADFPGADFNTIQDAVDAADDGDTILVYPGTYTAQSFAQDVVDLLGKAVLLQATDTTNRPTIDGEGLHRCVACRSGETASTVITGFRLTGGASGSGGGMLCDNASSPTITDCHFTLNAASDLGGGIFCTYGSVPAITDCTFADNTAYYGGAIACEWNASPAIADCSFTSNDAEGYGGAISCTYDSSPTVDNCTMAGNNAFYGGAIHCEWNASPVFTGCHISSSTSIWGTVFFSYDTAPIFTSGSVTGNTANAGGGFVVAWDGGALIQQTTVQANTTTEHGGGVHFLNSVGTITDCTIDNNASGDGGGIFCEWSAEDGEVSIIDCTITGNSASATAGGGICCTYASPLITGCNILNNSSSYIAGGLLCHEGNPVVDNCTLSGNDAVEGGGGLACANDASPAISGCTISNNNARLGGGMYFVEDCNPGFSTCDITSNTSDHGGGFYSLMDCDPTFTTCTISDNVVEYAGGAASASSYCDILFTDCSMTGNSAAWDALSDGIDTAAAAAVTFAGSNTSNSMQAMGDAPFIFTAESVCDVSGNVTPSDWDRIEFDIDNLSTTASLLVDEVLTRQGCLSVTNDTGSLVDAHVGDIIPLVQAGVFSGAFDSVVLPTMPQELALQLIEYLPNRGKGGGTVMALEVIGVEGTNFTSPFSEILDSEPVDIVSFDADGDGADEIAVLFGGAPGGVAVYSVSEDAPPALIDGLVEMVGNDPVDLDAGDLNGDGLGDLIVANGDDSTLSVLLTQEDVVDGSLYFDVSTVTVPGAAQTLTCVAVIDWDYDTDLDAVVGIDQAPPFTADGYQIILNVATMPGAWWLFDIPLYEGQGDAPTAVTGGDATGAWGFAGGTRFGGMHHAEQTNAMLNTLAELGGNRVVTIEAVHMDGDGQLDIMAVSDETESIYLLAGDEGEADGFGALIPISVSEPVEDVVVLDVDADDDMDMIMTAPGSDTDPLLLLRNDGPVGGGLLQSLGGNVWSKQSMANAQPPHVLASGSLNNKDDDDDWVIGGGGGLGFAGETGVLEQTNLLGDGTTTCPEDIDGNGVVNIDDLLLVLGNYNGTGEGDVDGNGVVNIDDMLLVIGAWNASC